MVYAGPWAVLKANKSDGKKGREAVSVDGGGRQMEMESSGRTASPGATL